MNDQICCCLWAVCGCAPGYGMRWRRTRLRAATESAPPVEFAMALHGRDIGCVGWSGVKGGRGFRKMVRENTKKE